MNWTPVVAIAAALAIAPVAAAQKWEFGAGAGATFYTTETVKNAIANADVSLSHGPAFSVWLGNNSGNRLGGEIRYDYEKADLTLNSGAGSASFAARTQALHYDLLFHTAPRSAHVRAFVSVGGGFKAYTGAGQELPFQRASDIAVLTKTTDTKPLVAAGFGVKIAVRDSLSFRIEVHDYLTPFPKKVIAPAPGSTVGGWLQDFVPSVGIAFTF